MRKAVIGIVVGLVLGAFSMVSALEFYGDAGIGVGFGFTSIDGQNVKGDAPSDVSDLAVELGAKFGFRLLDDMPLYGVIEVGGIGHRLQHESDWVQYNSYIIGPGVVFYPVPPVQLAASVGYSFAAIVSSNDPPMGWPSSSAGFAWNVSAGYEFGSGTHRPLIGVKLSGTHNSLSHTLLDRNLPMNSTAICFFVRYVFRGGARN
jgi:hypothetical protein